METAAAAAPRGGPDRSTAGATPRGGPDRPPVGARIDVPYADTRAGELSYALGLARLPALKTINTELAGIAVELRILGSSHQVLVRPLGRPQLSETVACLGSDDAAGSPGEPLPRVHRHDQRLPGAAVWRYEMASRIEALSGRADELDALVRELEAAPTGVVGVFPGRPHAFTGLLASRSRGGLRWDSWHAYPQTGELVRTRSRLEQAPA